MILGSQVFQQGGKRLSQRKLCASVGLACSLESQGTDRILGASQV